MSNTDTKLEAALDIRPLSNALGAEIRGVDLSKPLDDTTVAAIKDAWHEHIVLLFRDQDIDADQQTVPRVTHLRPTKLRHQDVGCEPLAVGKHVDASSAGYGQFQTRQGRGDGHVKNARLDLNMVGCFTRPNDENAVSNTQKTSVVSDGQFNVQLAEVLRLSQHVSGHGIVDRRNQRPAADQVRIPVIAFQSQVRLVASNVPCESTGVPGDGDRSVSPDPWRCTKHGFLSRGWVQ